MAAGGVRFGAVHVARFVDPFEPRHAVLFVELRALRQIGHSIEIGDLKQVGAAFGSASDNLRGDDFRKVPSAERFAKGFEQRCLHPKNVAHRFVPKRQRTILDLRLQPDRAQVCRGLRRQVVAGPMEHANLRDGDFAAGPGARFRADRAVDFDRVLYLEMKIPERFGGRDTLRLAGTIA